MEISTDLIYDVKRDMLAKYPRFGSEIAVSNIEFKENLPYHTAATDGKNVYVDPNYFESLSEDDRLFLIAHEIMHIKFMHMFRLKDKDGKKRDLYLWNIVTDAIINANLERDGFTIKEGYVIDGASGFVLEPFDVVEVRRSPGYQVQRRVTIAGEAVFAGGYTLMEKNERLSDLVKRAGGLTPDAYVKGGRLIRQMNEEERAQRQAALDMALMNAGSDSISVAKLRLSDRYTVGIELDKALANPGSDYDVVLREGDYLYIPEYISTVKITGEVQYPNTVTYLSGKGFSYYVNQAGGYAKMAKKRRAYVVHMNGTVSRLKRLGRNKIEPGSQIIIPSKKERKGVNIAEIMALTTSATSIGTMAATIANLTK